ncbi:hypothetical protein D3C81_1373460 [compost metagenome]
MPVRLYRRVAFEEVAEQRHDVVAAERLAHAHLQCPARLAAGAGQVGDGVLDTGETAADFRQEALAGLGQRQAARTTLEQSHTQVVLQPGDVLAHRGRSQTQAPRGSGEAAGFRAADEAFDTAESFHATNSKPLVSTEYSDYQLPGKQSSAETGSVTYPLPESGDMP